MCDNLKYIDREVIEDSLESSMIALKDLLGNNTIDMERQPNSENKLYLSIIERIQEEQNFRLINMKSTKQCNVVKMGKPSHLAVLKRLVKALQDEKMEVGTATGATGNVESGVTPPKGSLVANLASGQ